MLLSTPNEGSYSKSSISLLMVVERKSRIEGDKSAFYDVPTMQLSTFFDRFIRFIWISSKMLDLAAHPIFGVGHWIGHFVFYFNKILFCKESRKKRDERI